MKLKRISAIFGGLCVFLTLLNVPVLASSTPNGDWIDTTGMVPAYEVAEVELSNGGTITDDKIYSDVLMEFEVTMNSDDRFQLKTHISENHFNGVLIQQSWAATNQSNGKNAQYYYNSAASGTKNGWITYTDRDTDYPSYTSGSNVAFRMQIQGSKASLWAADLDADEPVYKYAGYYTYPEGHITAEEGTVLLYTMKANTIRNFRIYNLKGAVEITSENISAKPNSSFDIKFSLEPERTLNTDDFTIEDLQGNVVDVIGNVTGSASQYTITLDDWLLYGTEYVLKITDGLETVQGFGIADTKFKTCGVPAYKTDIAQVSVSEGNACVTVEKNVNEEINAVVVLGVYNISDGAEECVDIKAQMVTNESRNSFDVNFTEVADGSIVRAYVLSDLDTIKSMALPKEN